MLGRPDDGVRLRLDRADVGQFVHGSRHPRDPRRDAADRQRDVDFNLGGDCGRQSPARFTAVRRDRRSRCSRRNCASRRTTTAGSSGWSARFYSDIDRHYGQRCRRRATTTSWSTRCCCGRPAARAACTSTDLGAPADDMPFYSNIPYHVQAVRGLRGGALSTSARQANLTVGAPLLRFLRRPRARRSAACSRTRAPATAAYDRVRDGVLPRVLLSYDINDNVQLNAQASEGFRLGGINDPLNTGLCSPGRPVDLRRPDRFRQTRRCGTTSSARRSTSRAAAASSTSPCSTPRSTTCR